MNDMQHKGSVRDSVMNAIRKGHVHMRPRWHFALLTALIAVGSLVVFFTLLYVASLALFFLRDSGALYATSFGARGWSVLLRQLPWVLILLILAFVIVLGLLVRHFSFVYRKPLLMSVLGIVAVMALGGMLGAPLHRDLAELARRSDGAPLSLVYGHPLRSLQPADAYHGRIIAVGPQRFMILDEDQAGTTTVIITPRTRLPYGENFSVGERVLVVGDQIATGTVKAYGVREIDEYPGGPQQEGAQ